MVTIKKDSSVLTVTRGAYENFFQGMGYELIAVAQSHENSGGYSYPPEYENGDLEDVEPEEEESEDLSEIPLSEMSFAQLHERAGQLGIDHVNMHSKKELKAAIKEQLNK